MNLKLNRVIEDIEKNEKKVAEAQAQLKVLRQQRKQLEDQEIIKSIRSMQLSDGDMLRLLYGIQDGNVHFTFDNEGNMKVDSGTEAAAESEDSHNEKVD